MCWNRDFIVRGVALTPMIIARRDCVLDVGMFDDTPRFQDHIFMLKLLKHQARVGVLNEPLAVHYEHSGHRITNSDKSFSGYMLRMKMEETLFPFLSTNELSSAKFKHATLKSKIITDQKHLCWCHISFKKIHLIRTCYDFNLFSEIL